ncbi:holin [Bifidobacterium sp. ESL0682]|uniref:holin n=1 Tax=Bifidobacterium sp. ESL0682 TaxID=2983212 RepID=UPI0023F9D1C0|nr:holin [Bifidobacterium sp. ESL0682]WEV41651.1 holin [Bifidobacterium sp. ESL0682]
MAEEETPHEAEHAARDNTSGRTPFTQWCKAAAIRALKTGAQAALATIPTTAATIGSVNWPIVLGTAALAALCSILTSIAGVPEVQDGASLPQLK